ncbi:hypothetical protein H6G00_00850 [Leptolyngbya sp. FACHB-541]|uniref:hypothetical protein n=1 Tax=Leptolyngbya sp. FACHB-541 TaxID=2692810 RepID=UPI001686D9B0|nr:hypothetical protein [Leptolyngbya sp. FACHB-541]MBD1995176.1 hypothetical protein [Leptolyngbya sp. FACHB-541]
MHTLPDIQPTEFRLLLRSALWSNPQQLRGNYRYLEDALEDLQSAGYAIAQIVKAEWLNPRGEWQQYKDSLLKELIAEVLESKALAKK